MQILLIIRVLGIMMCGEAVLMLPSLAVALIYGEGDATAFLVSMALLTVIGLPLSLLIRAGKQQLFARDGFALVGFAWLLLSAFGALPYVLSGVTPSYVDALFESTSGFTTTGASILRFVEGQPHGILFWRSFSHWAGGMGVLVLTIAVLPQLGSRNMEILRAESTGPAPGKLMPRLRESARALYIIYIVLSTLMAVSLLIAGMPVFDTLVNTFATAGTGGFSVLNRSIGGYGNLSYEIIIGVFMLLFGVNFALYFASVMGGIKRALHNQELILYAAIVAVSILLIAVNILPMYGVATSLRHAFFQVSSIITTTGYSSLDYDVWPTLSKVILLFLTALGACAGSTAGGIKVSRLLLMSKAFQKEVSQIVHPRIVRPVTLDGKVLDDNTLRSVLVFFFAYVMVCVLALVAVSLDGFDFMTSFSAVLTAVSNVGPGLAGVGPAGNFAGFSSVSKLVLCLCMLIGRLEILPILLLFSPSLWRRT